MKRLLVAICLLLLMPAAAHAFDTGSRPVSIAIDAPDHIDPYFIDALRNELRERGYDAFDATQEDGAADYAVVIARGDARTDEHGGFGVADRHHEISFAFLTSRIGGTIHIYDGETEELIAEESFSKKNTAFLPTSIGGGRGALFAWVALPFIERAQYRRVVRAVADDAAAFVTATLRGE